MSGFVVDCSVTMAWCFEDASNAYAEAALNRLTAEEAFVPTLWPLEVANVLLVGERRKRLTGADSARFLTLLRSLPITLDEEASARAFSDILSLGRAHGLTVYDAAYLELAMRLGLPLATTGEGLKRAATTVGAAIL